MINNHGETETLTLIKGELEKILFQRGAVKAKNLFMKYVDPNTQKELDTFVEYFKECATVSENRFNKDLPRDNAFASYYSHVTKYLDKFTRKYDYSNEEESLIELYEFAINKFSIIVRKLLENENEVEVYMDTNRAQAKFFEVEAVKMLATAMITREEEKFDFATKYNDLVNWVSKELGFTEREIAAVLRFTVLSITKDTSFHIGITEKANEEKKVSGVVKHDEKVKKLIKSDYNKFIEVFEQYLTVYATLKKGVVSTYGSAKTNILKEASDLITVYSFVFNTLNSLNERFSYLIVNQIRKILFFENEFQISGKRSRRKEIREEVTKRYFAPVQKFLELILLEFTIHGTNTFKKLESAFDKVFVDTLDGGDFISSFKRNVSDKHIAEEDINKLEAQLRVKDSITEIHSDTQIQTMILILQEIYLMKKDLDGSIYSVMSEIAANCSDITIEHVIPQEVSDFENEELLATYVDMWFFLAILERNLNAKAGNKPLEQKKSPYSKSAFYLVEKFMGYETFEDMIEAKENIREERISMIKENFSLFD